MSAIGEIREKFNSGEFQYKKTNDICRLLGVSSRAGREAVSAVLAELLQAGDIVRDERGRFVSPEKLSLVKGVLSGNERGFAFLVRDGESDLFIPHRSLHGAQHKDTVFARILGGERGDEAEVYSILSRGVKELTGTYYREERGGCVLPDDKKYYDEIRIVGGKQRAFSGEKVFIKITAWPEGRRPEGEIAEVLGKSGDLSTEEDALIKTYSLAEDFPQKALSEARKVCAEKMPLAGRRDLRDVLTITIDGEDARDFDDAISIERAEDGIILGVHIADVSHYVRRGGALDKEAYARGTSVYFPDRVLPMLPVELSNGICSLREGEDRLTLSCIMKVDKKGRATDPEIAQSVIRSHGRMTYTDVAKILDGDAVLRERYAHLVTMLEDCRELAEILIRKREARGSVDLDVKEAKILYENGTISIPDYERTVSHEMIEQFMVLANESVATIMTQKGMPFVYRIHERPNEEKAQDFFTFLREAGLHPRFDPSRVTPADYQKLLRSLEDSPLYPLVNRVMLRSMMKAAYSPENVGHFGLASDCYCHFTSPIRRYPDLCIHRIIKESFLSPEKTRDKYKKFVTEASVQSSARERNAAEAERDVDALYTVAYMQDKIGEEYDATISGVTSFGIFAELANTVEGLIPIETLPDDSYEFIEERFQLRGMRNSFHLGEAVRVRVSGVDWGTRRVQFRLLGKKE